jgi:hypothetical protein
MHLQEGLSRQQQVRRTVNSIRGYLSQILGVAQDTKKKRYAGSWKEGRGAIDRIYSVSRGERKAAILNISRNQRLAGED